MSSITHRMTAESPSEALARRLDDPATAQALNALLDNADLLAVMVEGLSGFVARSETITEAIADGVNELKTVAGGQAAGLPTIEEAGKIAAQLAEALPIVTQVLESKMLEPNTIAMLGEVGAAATEGFDTAKRQDTRVTLFGALGALRDPHVQKGLGALVEIGRALGTRMQRDG